MLLAYCAFTGHRPVVNPRAKFSNHMILHEEVHASRLPRHKEMMPSVYEIESPTCQHVQWALKVTTKATIRARTFPVIARPVSSKMCHPELHSRNTLQTCESLRGTIYKTQEDIAAERARAQG